MLRLASLLFDIFFCGLSDQLADLPHNAFLKRYRPMLCQHGINLGSSPVSQACASVAFPILIVRSFGQFRIIVLPVMLASVLSAHTNKHPKQTQVNNIRTFEETLESYLIDKCDSLNIMLL